MPKADPTCIGRVRHVLGSTVTVALSDELAGVAPIYRGRLLAIGQIGSLVRIPQGLVDLIASVDLVGIAELTAPAAPAFSPQRDERWLQIQLLGEIDRGTGRFQRGIGTFPSLDDNVHFVTPDELQTIFPPADATRLRLGRLAAAEEIPVCLDASRLVVRHSAVVGSTGSGKTSAVASILQNFVRGGWQAANIVVVDPHGEYSKALAGSASVRSVLGGDGHRLRVPYWALPAKDIIQVFTGATGSATFANRFSELVTVARREFVQSAVWLPLDPSAVTADTPVPFDIRPIWHRIDAENRETRTLKADPATAAQCLINPGDAATLIPAQYQPYNPGGAAPFQAPTFNAYGSTPHLLRLGLLDPQLAFFQVPAADPNGQDPLISVVQDWLGGDSPVSVLDFSGVTAIAADLAIGVVMNLIFELCIHTPPPGPGIGRPSPVLIVLEEAHRYLGANANALTREAANKIAREGRKYGIGLMLVTQRPTEMPDTALAQCGTIVALRLTNTADQGAIRGALPDTVAGLASVLPSLRTGEAIVSGEALVLPVRVLLDRPNPTPLADDPSLESWRQQPHVPHIEAALAHWRGTYEDGNGN